MGTLSEKGSNFTEQQHKWKKHKWDTLSLIERPYQDRYVKIVCCSRHRPDGRLLGYIVQVIDEDFSVIVFKRYYYLEVTELSVWTDFQLGILGNKTEGE